MSRKKKKILTITQVYDPTSVAPEPDISEFYEILEMVVTRERGDLNLILGDWNAKVGTDMPPSSSIGEFRIGLSNESGERLVQLALENNLKIINTFYDKPEPRKWTWKSSNNTTKNEIDHSLVDDLSVVENCEILNKFQFSSDHRTGRLTLNLGKRKNSNRKKCTIRDLSASRCTNPRKQMNY